MTIIDYADFWMPVITIGIIFAGCILGLLTIIALKMTWRK